MRCATRATLNKTQQRCASIGFTILFKPLTHNYYIRPCLHISIHTALRAINVFGPGRNTHRYNKRSRGTQWNTDLRIKAGYDQERSSPWPQYFVALSLKCESVDGGPVRKRQSAVRFTGS